MNVKSYRYNSTDNCKYNNMLVLGFKFQNFHFSTLKCASTTIKLFERGTNCCSEYCKIVSSYLLESGTKI